MTTELPEAFTRYASGRYWGTTPESLLLYNSAAVTDDQRAWDALRRYYDLTVFVTNHRVDWETYVDGIGTVVDGWFDTTTSYLAQYATPETAQQFVLGAAYEAEGGVMRLLRLAQEEAADSNGEEPIVLSRRDAKSVAAEADIRMLRSQGVLRATTEGYRFRHRVIRALYGSRELNREAACWAILARICRARGIADIDAIIPPMLDAFDIEPPEAAPTDVDGSLPIYAGDSRVAEFVERVASAEADEVFAAVGDEYRARSTRLARTTGIKTANDPRETPVWPLTDRQAAVCALAGRQDLPVATGWLVDDGAAEDRFALHRELAQAGFDVALDEDLLIFEEPYAGPADADAVVEYESYIEKERAEADAIAAAAQQLSGHPTGRWDAQLDALLAEGMAQLDDVTVAPTRFVFSMFDPVHHADEYEIEEYVGDSPHLRDEVDRIREWREEQPHDATTFADQVRETCARPLEADDVAPRLRIMTPWINFIIQEYTALVQQLLANGVQVQLLLRLPDPGDWNDLKNNFLTRVGDTHGNLSIRTYTRYKRFKNHGQLRKHKRGERDDEGDGFVSETGVHAKLYIAGETDNGEVLAGSANLMENSFYYNPEAGLHSRHPEVIQTAGDYFDLIWELAAPDQIDKSVFTGKTNFEFYPKLYRS
jgi:hypothetical protein